MVLATQNEIERSDSLAKIIPAIKTLSSFDKLKLIRILAEELESAKDVFPFESGKTYQITTPYNIFGAAEVLAETAYPNMNV